MREVLFQTPDLLVRHTRGKRPGCIVTFDSYTDVRSLDRAGFGEAFFAQRDISAVHFISRDNDWWQYPYILDAIATVRAHLEPGGGPIATYGASMGGYAAVRFAPHVGAVRAFAVAPQFTIDPSIVPFETRWLQDARRIRWLPFLNDRISGATETIIAYDPHAHDDREHVMLIASDIRIREIKLPFAGHSALAVLHEMDELSALLHQIILPEHLDISETQIRKKRRQSSTYLASVAQYLYPRHSKWSLHLAANAFHFPHPSRMAFETFANILRCEKRPKEAVKILQRAADLTERNVAVLHSLSCSQREAGLLDDSYSTALECVTRSPEVALFHKWMADLSIERGDSATARQYVAQAIALTPDDLELVSMHKRIMTMTSLT